MSTPFPPGRRLPASLARLAAAGALVASVSSLLGQQIAPNPNPGVIVIPDDGTRNSVPFSNEATGRIEADNGATFTNFAELASRGTIAFSNVATFENEGGNAELRNEAGGSVEFTNGTTLDNRNSARVLNLGTFSNRGLGANVINALGAWFGNDVGATFTNAGLAVFTNRDAAQVINLGELTNDGATLVNEALASIENRSVLGNPAAGTMTITNGGALLNRSLILNHQSGTLTNQVGSLVSIEPTGELRNDAGGIVNNSGIDTIFRNQGLLTSGGTVTRFSNVFTATLSNEGSDAVLTNEGGAALANRSGSTLDNRQSAELRNRNGATLTNTGDGTILRNREGATLDNSNAGIIINENFAFLENDAVLTNTGEGSEIRNLSNAEIGNSGSIRNQDGALIDNAHELHIHDQGSLINESNGRIENADEITCTGPGSALTNRDGATLANAGILLNAAGSVLTNRDGAEILNEGNPGLFNSGIGAVPLPVVSQLINDNATIRSGGPTSLVNESMALLVNRGAEAEILVLTGSSLVNREAAQVLNLEDATIVVDFSSTVANSAIFVNEARVENGGTLENSGRFTVAAGSMVTSGGLYRQTAGVTVVDGLLSQRIIEVTGGTLSGGGVVRPTASPLVIGEGATVSPGDSAGTLTVDGGLAFRGGTLAIDLDIAGSGHDLVRVTGPAEFDGGRILLSVRGGSDPYRPAVFQVIDAGSIDGFETLGIEFAEPPPPGFVFRLGPGGTLVARPFRIADIRHFGDRVEVRLPYPEAGMTYRLIRHATLPPQGGGIVVATATFPPPPAPPLPVLTLVDDGSVRPLPPDRAFYVIEAVR